MTRTTSLFDSNGPSPSLLALLEFVGLSHDRTIRGIRDAIQEEWYHVPLPVQRRTKLQAWYARGELRMALQKRYGKKLPEILPILQELGMVDAVAPQLPPAEYGFALILAARERAMRNRVQLLVESCNAGTHVSNCVFIGCDQSIMPQTGESLFVRGEDIDAHPTRLSQEFGNAAQPIDVEYYVSPLGDLMSQGGGTAQAVAKKGRLLRTFEAARDWIRATEEVDTSSRILVVSTQPQVATQRWIMQEAFGPQTVVDAIGLPADPSFQLCVYLEHLADWIGEIARVEGV